MRIDWDMPTTMDDGLVLRAFHGKLVQSKA
jgi:hypothetical protein